MHKSDFSLKKPISRVNFGGKSAGGGSACDLNDEEQVSRSYIIPNVSQQIIVAGHKRSNTTQWVSSSLQ